jgi:hypothetical protein
MFTAVKLINDGVIASPNAANLNINTSAGVLYGLGIGYVTNKLNPNSLTINSQSPATFQYRTQTGGTAANTTLIDPLNRDVNGVITPITGTKATNQRIYLLQNGQIRIQYGQQEYNQLAAAVAALQNEVFVTFPNFRDNGILIGILSVLSTCTQLNDTSKAQFFSVSKFGELIGAAGGTSTTTLQQAYNNSSEPEIVINSTLDGFSLKNGTGNEDNVSQLLQGINSGGTVTSFIRADGAFSGTSIFGTGLTATTVSATTYYNLPVSGLTSSTYITTTPNNGNYTISLNGPLLSYYVSGSTPSGTQVSGDRWLNTTTGDELVWVDDGDSQQWIQISSIVGGGGGSSTSTATTFIASSNCAILSDANTYIGYSKAGWSYYAWDTTDSSFGYDSANCGIPISENIVEGQTINVCGVAYSAGLGSEGLRLYIYKLSCSDLSTINNVYTSSNEIFDSNGNLCFSFDYLVGSGEDFIKCSDFIVLGFRASGATGETIKISYKITAS